VDTRVRAGEPRIICDVLIQVSLGEMVPLLHLIIGKHAEPMLVAKA
jgi:hypothetical protein